VRRVLRRTAFVAAGVVALVAAAFVVPAFVDWRPYTQGLAADVREATGHDLVFAGELDVRLLPRPRLTATQIRLEADGGPPLLTIERLRLGARLLPLLGGRLEVDELSVDAPHLALTVDADGRPNWQADAGQAAAGDAVGLPALSLPVARLKDGRVSFVDARSGRRIEAREIALTVALPALDAPLDVAGDLTFDGLPLTFNVGLTTPARLLAGDLTQLAVAWQGERLAAAFTGGVVLAPALSLSGNVTAETPSLAALADWLGRPLAADPGALTPAAQAEIGPAGGAVTDLALAVPDLDVEARGTVHWGDGLPSIDLALATGVLDLDPYLPAPDAGDDAPAPLDAPIDLAGLAGFNAIVRLDSAGARLAAEDFATIDALVTVRDGALAVRLQELGFGGGTVRGTASVGATADGVQGHADLSLDAIDLAEPVARLTDGAVTARGASSGTVSVAAAGATPRALLTDLSGRVAFELGGETAPADTDALTRLSFDAAFAGADAGPRVAAHAVYRGRDLDARLALGPLEGVLAGARFPLEVEATSALGRIAYKGAVNQRPERSLDGTLTADVPALGALLTWLDRPLDVEPGPVMARIELVSDGATGTIEAADLAIGDFTLTATGGFDTRGDIPDYRISLQGGMFDVDTAHAVFGPTDDEGEDEGAAVRARLDEPLDLAPLRARNVELDVTLAGMRIAGVESGEVRLAAALNDGRLTADLAPVDWGAARLDARLEVDATTDETAARLRGGLEAAEPKRLLEALDLDDHLSGAIVAAFDVATAGTTVATLADRLNGSAEFQFDSFSLADEDLGGLDEVAVSVMFDPRDTADTIDATIVGDWRPPGDDPSRPAELRLTVAPATTLLRGDPVPLETTLVLGDARLTATGTVADPFGDMAPVFNVRLEAPSLADLDAIAEERLPPLGPVRATARLTRDGDALRFDNLEGAIATANVTGEVDLYPLASPFALRAALVAGQIDISPIPDAYWDRRGAEMAEDPRLFPATPFNLAKLRKTDAEFDVRIAEFRGPYGYDIDAIAIRATVDGGRLDLVAEYDTRFDGRAGAVVVLDGRSDPPEVKGKLEFADKDFGEMLAAWGLIGQATGNASTSFDLTARGDSLRDWASTVNGDFELKVGDGEFNDAFMGAMAFGLGDAFRPLLGGERETRLNCLVVRLDFENGVGTVEPLLLHTSSFYAVGQGTIDLRDETIDARIDTGTDKVSLTRFALPIRVTGSLKDPDVEVVKTSG